MCYLSCSFPSASIRHGWMNVIFAVPFCFSGGGGVPDAAQKQKISQLQSAYKILLNLGPFDTTIGAMICEDTDVVHGGIPGMERSI